MKEESLQKTLRGRGRGEAVKGAEEGKYQAAPEALGNQRWKQFSRPKERVTTEEQLMEKQQEKPAWRRWQSPR